MKFLHLKSSMTICAMVAMSLFFFASANEDIDSGLVQADDDMDYKRAQLSSLITYLVNALENSEEDSSENEEKFRKSIYLPRIGTEKRSSIFLPRIGTERRSFYMPRVGRGDYSYKIKKMVHMPRIG